MKNIFIFITATLILLGCFESMTMNEEDSIVYNNLASVSQYSEVISTMKSLL